MSSKSGENVIIVTLRNTKTKKQRAFSITLKANGIELYRKLTSQNTSYSRFFVCYRNGKCTVIKIFYRFLKKIAENLKLSDSNSFTDFYMRKNLSTLLGDNDTINQLRMSFSIIC